MKKISLLIVVFGFYPIIALSQPCPDSLYITSQAQIDSFQINYPNCTEIEGNVKIFGGYINISNLNGLSVLTYIGGDVFIGYTVLTNLTGLNNVDSIGGYLEIYVNDALTSLTGMDNLTAIGGGLEIESHGVLTSLSGLDNVTSVGGDLYVSDNDALINIEGLGNVMSIGGNLIIRENISLSNLSDLNSVTFIGGHLLINLNDALTTITGLANISTIGGEFGIFGNINLTSLTGFDNLTSIGGAVVIYGNTTLSNLMGLDNVTSIGGNLKIGGNTSLINLTGLNNIDASSIDDLEIWVNESLSTCDVQSICDYLAAPSGTVVIHDNAPGCNSIEEVQDSCEAHAGYIDIGVIENGITIYPNPACQELNISKEGYTIDEVTIYTLTGQQIIQKRPANGTVDISDLQPGMYIVEVTVENTRIRQKLLVQR